MLLQRLDLRNVSLMPMMSDLRCGWQRRTGSFMAVRCLVHPHLVHLLRRKLANLHLFNFTAARVHRWGTIRARHHLNAAYLSCTSLCGKLRQLLSPLVALGHVLAVCGLR